jgi:lysyl-tRNA synthetase class I
MSLSERLRKGVILFERAGVNIDATKALMVRAATTIDTQAAEIERLRASLDEAVGWFRDYERQHRAKGSPDADAKAETNKQRADFLAQALNPNSGGERE